MASDEEEVIPVKELPEEHLDDGRSAPETPSKKPIPSTAASSRPSPPPVANGQNTRNDNKYSDKTAETQLQSEEDSDTTLSDIPDFDWEEFLQKYVRAIEAATSEEKGLISQFNHLSEAFSAWADAAGEYDNLRAWKRIKTRECYVHLSEDKLDEKKRHFKSGFPATKA